MNKQLPLPKKSLKSFILENDAKITDKTAAKITITTAFLAINIAAASQDANAKGHSNHNSHANNLNVDNDYGTGYHVGNNPTEVNVNSIQDKSVLSAHGNHYNHSDGGGGQGGGLLSIAFGVALGFVTGGFGLSLFAWAPSTTFTLGSIAGLTGAMGGAVIGGATSAVTDMMTGGLGEGAVSQMLNVDTGTPHTVPAPIINELKIEESN